MQQKPLILVTNDDGISAKGVHELIKSLKHIGDVVCVCPERPQSGMGMALTVNSPLFVKRLEDYLDTPMYKVSGTPVDCVKMAVDNIMERKPDILVSGINHGSNAAVNVVYSGTMGAAFEGLEYGIPSIGFSLTTHNENADFTPCFPVVDKLVRQVLENGLPEDVCLNVNMPAGFDSYKEIRIARGCKGRWKDGYREYMDPTGRPFYWLEGKFINEEPENTETDEWCLSQGIVSVVPVMLERTYPGWKELTQFESKL